MAAIQVEGLVKTYRVSEKKGEGILPALRGLFHREYRVVRAVDGISFSIDPAEMVAFLGPNGAGKTTTLKMLSGLIYPTAGAALVRGCVPWERSDEYRRQFALVMGQKNQLWWDLPARESFLLHKEIYSIDPDRFRTVHDQLVDLLGLEKLIGVPVRELSLGERMKMELVAALLHGPRVLFLDEPTIGLDVVAQTQLRDFLKAYNRAEEVTVLLTSHYMKDVETLCERVIVINHGRLIHDGSLAEIQSAFGRHKIVKAQFAVDVPAAGEVAQWGELIERKGPVVTFKVDRDRSAKVLADLLSRYQVADVTVDEPPLEEVIAEVFQSSRPAEEPAVELAAARDAAG